MTEYRDYSISFDPKPIPYRDYDYNFAHKDYDGPEDKRCGNGGSIEDCKDKIDEQIEDADEADQLSQPTR